MTEEAWRSSAPPRPVAARVLELTGIAGYIPVYQTVAEALLTRDRPEVTLRANQAEHVSVASARCRRWRLRHGR